MTRMGLIAIALTLTAAVLVLAGAQPFGRVLMAVGLPNVALPLLEDPRHRGAAHFAAGDFSAAMTAFEAADDAYNHGLAAAWAGDYATALVAWDRHLALSPQDAEARANHALVTSLMAGTEFDAVEALDPREREGPTLLADPGQGGAKAASTGDEANNSKTGFWMPEITSEGLRRVPKIFDAQFVAANQRWLETLEDQPGRYLKARLAAEQKARLADGTAQPTPEDSQ